MKPAASTRFPTVALLDSHGKPTGMTGQRFAVVVDDDGNDTGKVAVMLTAGGQGCKHWPADRVEIIEDRHEPR